ncbi:BTAD domain-containing putative transcriptional regulator [Streptomyces sp. NPDC006283]|uniref:BTAD domain-containing putative transcriptional regulator n=1 Tax=Streptomyces sp. NPDC006283 TaxID=3156741 RepID=UPI0033AD0BE3
MADERPPPVRVELLGPLRLSVGGTPVDVPGPKRRAVLAILALAEGRTVPVEHLLDTLWPCEVPESGRQALQNHVSRIRAHLGPAADRLETCYGGYRLSLGRDELDVARARALLATARATAPRDPGEACTLLREAHALWRGPVLADLTDFVAIATAVEGYAHLRQEVTDALVTDALAAGSADTILGIAAASSADDPLREPPVLLHMRALAATGQAPEALRLGREFRRRLADETGLDPSPALDELERDIIGAGGAAPAPQKVAERPATRLIGREQQIAALHGLLAAERLVTLVGPGGVGKTRVALEIARQSGDPAVLLLAPVTDPHALPHALAAALNLKVEQGDVLAACVAVLVDHPGLLVLDNCEHLLDAVRDTVVTILTSCPGTTLLATSREPLGLAAEHVSRLTPLTLPRPGQDPARAASVALFLDRARRVRHDPPPTPEEMRAVADIVRRLDGMPLAIELAAGRLSTFSLTDLRGRLDRSLDLLGGGTSRADARHRTLRATVEWSYRLLTEDERRLFRHLSVFADGVDLTTAEQLGADLGLNSDPGTVLARLVDASMMDASFGGTTRFRMLETLRAFGLDRLTATGEYDGAAARMVRWAVALTSWIAVTMGTGREPEADAVLRRELANLRAAWRLVRDRAALDEAAAMVTSLFDAIAYRDLVELRDWAAELAADPALHGHPKASAALAAAAEAAYHRGDYRRADLLARAGLENAGERAASWHCLFVLAVADLARGAYDDVVEHSLAATALGGPQREGFGMAALATAYAGDPDTARALNDRGRAAAVSPTMRSWGAYVAGEIESRVGHGDAAERHYVRAIDLARTSGATFLIGVATVGLQSVRAAAGRDQEALAGYRDVIAYFARNGNWTHLWTTLRNLADLLRRLGDEAPAALIDAAADRAPDAPAVEGGWWGCAETPRDGAEVLPAHVEVRTACDGPPTGGDRSHRSGAAMPTTVSPSGLMSPAPPGTGRDSTTPAPCRAAALDAAREAIARHLTCG